MSNGKSEVIEEIRALASDKDAKIPQRVYNRLMLAAIVDLYDTVKPMVKWKPTVDAVKWVGGVLIGLNLVLIWNLITHNFVWPF